MSSCYNCFKEYSGGRLCPHCGYDPTGQREKYPHALQPGAILGGKYVLGRVLGQGGFGITYVAQDYDTKKLVAIKEHFPANFVTRSGYSVSVLSAQHADNFASGKELFLAEAKTISQFNGQPNICDIYSYFEENGTAYFAMEYVEGIGLDKYIAQRGGKLSFDEARELLLPVMRALGNIHSKGIIHRDISPDNILITQDRSSTLIDFGAARYSMGEKSRSLDVVLKHGFAPKEQYTRHGRQGAYTDVYAMAATFYYAITGKVPPEAIDRIGSEEMILPSALGADISEGAEDVLLHALNVEPGDRYQSMWDFAEALRLEKHSGSTAAGSKKHSAGVSAPMHRAKLYLESADWKKAEEYFDHALDIDPENCEAYLGKLLAELRLTKEEQLKDCKRNFSKNPNYTLAIRFAEPALRARLESYSQAAADRASVRIPRAESEKLKDLGNKINNTVDASVKAVRGSAEQAGKLAKSASKEFSTQSSSKKKIIIAAAAAVLVLLLVLIIPGKGSKDNRSNTAARTPSTQKASPSPSPVKADIDWELDNNGVLTISGSGPMEDYGGYSQTPWHEYAEDIKKIVVSQGISTIGAYSFDHLEQVREIVLPDKLSEIKTYAFYSCTSLKAAELPDTVKKIGDFAFNHCEALESLALPDNLTNIGKSAFVMCDIRELYLPEGLKEIKDNCFFNCSSLEYVYIPDSLQTIGRNAFGSCTSLEELEYSGSKSDWKNIRIGESNECLLEAWEAANYTPTPTPKPTSTPAPKPTLKKTLLTGHWGAQEPIKNGTYEPFVLDVKQKDCKKIYMDLSVESYTGYPFGDWYLYAKDLDGNWYNAGSFRIEEDAKDGSVRSYVFEYSTPQNFQAITICTASKYANFNLTWNIDFYVDMYR